LGVCGVTGHVSIVKICDKGRFVDAVSTLELQGFVGASAYSVLVYQQVVFTHLTLLGVGSVTGCAVSITVETLV